MGDEAGNNQSCSSARRAKDQTMMQLKAANKGGVDASTLSVAQQRDQRISSHIRASSSESLIVARVIQQGITALISSIIKFTADPPQIEEGIIDLGTELLECV